MKNRQGRFPTGGGQDPVAKRRKDHLSEVQHHLLVVHHQDGLLPGQLSVFDDFFLDDFLQSRQIDANGAALFFGAGHRNTSAVIRNNPIDPGESQSAVAVFCGEERLENARHDISGDAGSGIADLNADIRAGAQSGGAILRRLGQLQIARLDIDASAAFERFDGVFKNLHQGLLQFGFVKRCAKEFFLQLERPGDARILRILKQFNGAAQQGIEVSGGLLPGILFFAAKGLQVLGNFSGSIRRLLDFDQ